MSNTTSAAGTAPPASGAVIEGRPAGATGPVNRHLGLALLVIATAQLMVVLDATIVNVALPHIQSALGFSGSGLEWVVNAYALTFGGLLLLGGRAGDILGRKRVFIAGIILFSVASLLGGFATTEAWLLGARALQGVGGAIVAPTALSLVTSNFPEGRGAQPGHGRLRHHEHRRRGRRPAPWRRADHVLLLALGAVRERADRDRGRPAGAARPGRVQAPPRPVRPARRDHRHAGPGGPGLRPVQRGHQPPTGCRTGATPRSSSRWRRRWCCWSRSCSSSRAASTR